METNNQETTAAAPAAAVKKAGTASRTVLITAMVIVTVVVLAAAIVVAKVLNGMDSGDTIGYATEAKVMLDQDSLQAAMDEAMANAANGNIGLSYVNDATSTDGIHFDCYLINSATNIYDMYITIYADAEFTDELYLSQLVPPGSGWDSLTLEHALDPGDHTVYVVITQVDTDADTGEQSVVGQVVYTMDFHVQ